MKFIYAYLLMLLISISIRGQIDSLACNEASDSSRIVNIHNNTISEERTAWHKMFTNIPYDYYEFFGTENGIGNSTLLLKTVLLSGALLPLDQRAYNFQSNIEINNPYVSKASCYTVFIGDGKFNLITAGLFSIYGFAAADSKALKTSSNIIESVVSTGLLVQLLKRMFGRESPIAASHSSGKWDLFPNLKKYEKNQARYYAFPSGHISTLTATVTVIANNYPEESWIKPVGYSAIGLVGVSLVSKGMHWYSDLPLGIYLGYTLGNIIAPQKKTSNNSEENHLAIYPVMTVRNNPGLGIIYHF